jgi:serine/threonine-protein kinase HipA
MKTKHLVVGTPQGDAGDLRKESRFVFNYSSAERAREISLAMPIRAESYSSGALLPIFEMNKPEGYLLSKIEEVFAKVGPLDDMALLELVGGSQIGRLTYRQPGREERRAHAPMSRKELLQQSASRELFDHLVSVYFDSGISGVQPKVLIPSAADGSGTLERTTLRHSDLIVKASGIEFPHLAANEFLCLSAAKRAGIEVPEFELSDDGGLLVVTRFDLQPDGMPLGFEDMAVLTGRSNREKYQGSYEMIARAIRLYCQGADPLPELQGFFEYVALMVMVRNGDGHLKNFGLLYEHPQQPSSIRLAPLFDVVTTCIYDISGGSSEITKYDRTLALKLAKTRTYPLRQTLLDFGRAHCNVARPEQVLDRIGTAMSDTLTNEGLRVNASLLTELTSAWDDARMSLEPHRLFT